MLEKNLQYILKVINSCDNLDQLDSCKNWILELHRNSDLSELTNSVIVCQELFSYISKAKGE